MTPINDTPPAATPPTDGRQPESGADVRIGITTTVPVEIVYAAGRIPCDLNNLLIADPDPRRLIDDAEAAGFPRTTCAWIKGIHQVVHWHHIRTVVAVLAGDCSNTHALAEVLAADGVEIIPFSFPLDRTRKTMTMELAVFARRLGAAEAAVTATKARLDRIRTQLERLDRATWEDGTVDGHENHLRLVAASDFDGDPENFAARLETRLTEPAPPPDPRRSTATAASGPTDTRPAPRQAPLRLGIIGVPTIITDLHRVLADLGAAVVFNEVPRQFAMPGAAGMTLAEQYLAYTYPYGAAARIADIRREIARRRLDGIIHYVQSFCYRHIEDIVFRRALDIPLLTVEGDRPGPVDGRTLIRLETFVEMLRDRRRHRT
ncbi:MAG: 2-hydroxyacyl-CoA dehydratase [Deltaproteobacteria bacterium]|nr:2-hydroxyacyl-CoA dehydratase [Candidatus Anaeroferrophillacea bacterium]